MTKIPYMRDGVLYITDNEGREMPVTNADLEAYHQAIAVDTKALIIIPQHPSIALLSSSQSSV